MICLKNILLTRCIDFYNKTKPRKQNNSWSQKTPPLCACSFFTNVGWSEFFSVMERTVWYIFHSLGMSNDIAKVVISNLVSWHLFKGVTLKHVLSNEIWWRHRKIIWNHVLMKSGGITDTSLIFAGSKGVVVEIMWKFLMVWH